MRKRVTSNDSTLRETVDVFSIVEGKLEWQLEQTALETEVDEVDQDNGKYNEQTYLIAFPDIAEAISLGEWESGLQHYSVFGQKENRLSDLRYRNAAGAEDTVGFPAGDIDAVFVTQTGWCLVIGWANDETAPLCEIVCLSGKKIVAAVTHIARCRRQDAEAAVTARHGKLLGFWTVFHVGHGVTASDNLRVCLATARERKTFSVQPRFDTDEHLREIALEYFAAAQYFTNPQIEATLQMQGGLGKALTDYNVEISNKVIAGAFVKRFGSPPGKLDGSIIVCLYGKSEYLFLQASAFSVCLAAERYEFIYVSNSPELAEALIKEATMANRIYGVCITLVILPSNAGFGAANNIAAGHARSDRILIVNPDVFPRGTDWALRHHAVVTGLPADQTAIFGAPLYYDDGSLMHAGMFFDIDTGVSIKDGLVEHHEIIRVEHYAKGAPPDTAAFLESRRVPAVTGAFISLDRGWFETLGGFSPDYVFGHYEDADLCLRSLVLGRPVWLHNVPFWHLEGKGSTRRQVHEGGSAVNRWHFTRLWQDLITTDLCGRSPKRFQSS